MLLLLFHIAWLSNYNATHYNWDLISIENMCLAMSNKFLLQLCIIALDRSMRSINSSNENNDFDCDALS